MQTDTGDSLGVLMAVPRGRHAAIIGQTGCGKSVLAETLLTNTLGALPSQNIICIDPKREFTFIEETELRVYDKLPNKWVKSWAFRPSELDYDNTELYDSVLKRAYNQGNTTLYIDDLAGVLGKTRKAPPWLLRNLQLGRSKGVSVIVSLQRPAWVPLEILSESTLHYAFYCGLPADRARMAEIMVAGFAQGGGSFDVGILEEFQFWAYDAKKRNADRCIIQMR